MLMPWHLLTKAKTLAECYHSTCTHSRCVWDLTRNWVACGSNPSGEEVFPFFNFYFKHKNLQRLQTHVAGRPSVLQSIKF